MIYLLEDDESIRELVCYSLNKTGTKAVGFETPSSFWKAISAELPELILLDIMLPEEDGLAVLTKLRLAQLTAKIPVIMLTAKSNEFDKVKALDCGADDYLTKPFGVMELIARVKAVMRRSQTPAQDTEDTVYQAGGLTVSVAAHTVTADGVKITLTFKEFELLCFLFAHRGAVLNRDQILREIWSYEFDGENRTVDVHIRTLRQKLGKYADVIETVRGVGYKIEGTPEK
ncbi:MAG: response regulator transcription factor [Eubacteriales bacterium]|nr:response regulator transcription factor [Eubacteriales bacterium]